jgi:hypothetical protein
MITFDLLVHRITTHHLDLFGGYPYEWAWVNGYLVISSCVDATNECVLTVYSAQSVLDWIDKANELLAEYGDDEEGTYDAIVWSEPESEPLDTSTDVLIQSKAKT